ncbi:hypothetical protein HDU97_000131 [Phlyctochytrium planicorne]|nr:hypothetical protein HDU97_000131 [Phlyctochytrium planicorne]
MQLAIVFITLIASVLASTAPNATTTSVSTAKVAAAAPAPNGPPPPGQCQCPPPNRTVGLGQKCGGGQWNSPVCEKDLSCVPPLDGNGQGTCVRLGPYGATCGRGPYAQYLKCFYDFECFSPSGATGGTCLPVIYAGESCANRPRAVCARGLSCISGTCTYVIGAN